MTGWLIPRLKFETWGTRFCFARRNSPIISGWLHPSSQENFVSSLRKKAQLFQQAEVSLRLGYVLHDLRLELFWSREFLFSAKALEEAEF
jgi:hypothetical protein